MENQLEFDNHSDDNLAGLGAGYEDENVRQN